MSTRRLFMGRMSNGEVAATISKPGYDASDPTLSAAYMQWSSRLGYPRLVASGTHTHTVRLMTSGAPAIGTDYVTVPSVSGSRFVIAQLQSQRWFWWTTAGSLYEVEAAWTSNPSRWYDLPLGSNPITTGWSGPYARCYAYGSTQIAFEHNCSGNVAPFPVFRYKVYDFGG